MPKPKIKLNKKALREIGNEAIRNELANEGFEVECPSCGNKIVLKFPETVCPSCGTHVKPKVG